MIGRSTGGYCRGTQKKALLVGVDNNTLLARDPPIFWLLTYDIGKALMSPKHYCRVDESVVDGMLLSKDDCSTGNGCLDCNKSGVYHFNVSQHVVVNV